MAKHPTTTKTSDAVKTAADADTNEHALGMASETTPPTSTPAPAKSKLTLEERVARLEDMFRAQGHQLD